MRDENIIERPANQVTITKRYTEESIRWIEKHKDQPFFLYLAHNLPHVPLFTSPEFAGTSRRGLYGDVIEEIDHSVGRILDKLREMELDKKTMVIFTSDNGPWLSFDEHGGSAGLLRDGKGSCWEGGMREPTIFWGPGWIKPGVVHDMGSTLDLFPTLLSLAGVPVPGDRIYDGVDLTPALSGIGPSPRKSMFYYHGDELYAARVGAYKVHLKTHTAYRGQPHVTHTPPLLFNIDVDPSEKYELQDKHPEILEKLMVEIATHRKNLVPVPSHIDSRIPR
jgi:arylsulfatase A-like enzyme